MNAIFVNGLSGKMGVAIKNLVLDDSDFKIVKKLIDSDLIIDFSRPESTMLLLQEAEEHSIPLIIGTTGFSEVEVNLIEVPDGASTFSVWWVSIILHSKESELFSKNFLIFFFK